MKQHPFFVAGIWPFLVFPTLLLLVYILFKQWHGIEADLELRTNQLFKENQIYWAKANTFNFGRDVQITGTAPDGDSVNKAIALASTVEGIRSTNFIGEVVKLSPASLSVSLGDDQANISGVLNSQSAVDNIIALAKKHYSGKINNKLTVNKAVAPMTNAETLLASLLSQKGASTELKGKTLIARGALPSEQAKADLLKKLRQNFDGEIIDKLTLDQRQICLSLINTALTDNKINFATGKAVIVESSYPLLEGIAKIIKNCPDAVFEVSGHTDSTGNIESNIELSQQRAQAVVDLLQTKHSIGNDHFQTKGYGPNKPIADNSTDQGKAQNRRIEFKLIKK